MAVTTQNGVTTLTPTSWKWITGGIALLFFFPIGTVCAPLFFLSSSGKLRRLTLSPEGLESRNWWKVKKYSWDEIGEIRINKIKSGMITAASMVSFTHANQEGTMLGKAAKLLAGGTHSLQAIGVSARKQAELMLAYQQGYAPTDTQIAMPAAAIPRSKTPRPQKLSQRHQAEQGRARAVPQASAQTNQKANSFGKRSASLQSKQAPIVEEGFRVFGRRPKTPYG